MLPDAISHHQAGRLNEAAGMYRAILEDSPQEFDAAHLFGVIALQQGRLADAQYGILAALKIRPDDQAALVNLTAVYLRSNQLELAAEAGERAARLLPSSVDAFINYGTALHRLGRFRDAIGPLEIAQYLNPRSTEVANLLGACLLNIGDAPRAATLFEIATQVTPTDASSWANLSTALKALSEYGRALECADKAVALGLDSSNALAAQAAAQFELGKIEESISTFKQAVALRPSIMMLCGLARALLTSGRHDEAALYLRRAVEAEPSNPTVRMQLTVSVLKPIYRTIAEIETSRVDFGRALEEMDLWYKSTTVAEAYMAVGAMQPFFIAYQPFNNRQLLSRYGGILAGWMSTLPTAAPDGHTGPRTGKFRIGIVSAHVRDQSVWNAILKGWIYHLDKSKFEILLYKLDPFKDIQSSAAKGQVAVFDDQPRSLSGRVDAIRNANLDAIIFDEVGMDSGTLQLAALRLAPLQAATWGHPETSGLPTIDFYLSGDILEPPNAQDNYSERLVRLPNLGVYVEPLIPKMQDPRLNELGLPDEPLLLCAGSPFKYSPLHDWVWIEIARGLRAHGRGRLVFFSTGTGNMHVSLLSRLRTSFEVARLNFDDSVCVVPWLDRPRFYGLMNASAIMLDTLDFSGFNTALQSIECGLPYLSYEGSFLRGRLASGLCRRMDLPELVATSYDEFVRQAVGLATDQVELRRLGAEIVARRDVLFRDIAPVRALEHFLTDQISESRARQN